MKVLGHHHKHEVNETRARSLLKAVTGRIIEISIGTVVFGIIIMIFFPGVENPFLAGFGLNVIEEALCFVVTYGTERIWNKINWGRKVVEIIAGNGSVQEKNSTTS